MKELQCERNWVGGHGKVQLEKQSKWVKPVEIFRVRLPFALFSDFSAE